MVKSRFPLASRFAKVERTAESPSNFLVRSRLSWPKAIVWAAMVDAILFVPIEWRGCGFFRYGAMELLHFGYVFGWLVTFFVLRMRWRLVLLAVTVPPLLVFFCLHGIAEENAGPEAAAVASLRQIRSSLEAHRSQHEQQGYPISRRRECCHLTRRDSINTNMSRAGT
jgi:hypothetical protein